MVKDVNATQTFFDTSDLVKKADMTQKLMKLKKKILDHDHGKYITTQVFNKLTADNFAAKLKQANSVPKITLLIL